MPESPYVCLSGQGAVNSHPGLLRTSSKVRLVQLRVMGCSSWLRAPGDILSINKMDNGLGRGEGVSNAGYLCGSSVTSPSGPFLRKVLLGQAR